MDYYDKNIVERVSEEIHNMWLQWANELMASEQNISSIRKKRWREECFKPYSELSEMMKDLDRNFAVKILNRINQRETKK